MGWFKSGQAPGSGGGSADPALDDALRAMEAAKQFSGPVDDSPPNSSELATVASWMRSAYAGREFQAVWEKRVELGYGISADGLDPVDWFSLNALGALSGIEIGVRDHPVVSMSAGYADLAGARTDEQKAQIDEIKRRYFG